MEIEILKYLDCYDQYGEWQKDLPFLSICNSCQVKQPGIYCSEDITCRNRWRDDCFWKQYQWENDSDYYPSDMEIYNYQDKRILKLAKVEQRPYYYSGIKMRELLLEACNNYDGLLDKGEAFNDALAKIASFGYNVSIKRFKIIINSMF